MSTAQANGDDVEEIFEKIEILIKLTNCKENLIIMEDWKAIVGEDPDEKRVGEYCLGTRKGRGDHLVELYKHDLIITNTLFKNYKIKRYTYKMPEDINKYQLDYILAMNRYKNQIKSSKFYPGADTECDYNLVMIKSELKFKRLEKSKNKEHK